MRKVKSELDRIKQERYTVYILVWIAAHCLTAIPCLATANQVFTDDLTAWIAGIVE